MKGIILKSIDVSKVSYIQQLQKCEEELQELDIAIFDNGTNDEVIEEFWDVVQSQMSKIKKFRGIGPEMIEEGYSKHLEKLKNRPR